MLGVILGVFEIIGAVLLIFFFVYLMIHYKAIKKGSGGDEESETIDAKTRQMYINAYKKANKSQIIKVQADGTRVIKADPNAVPLKRNIPARPMQAGEPIRRATVAPQAIPETGTIDVKTIGMSEEEYSLTHQLDKSFTAKMMQSEDQIKGFYSSIKNELMSYEGVTCKMSRRAENFRVDKDLVAQLRMRGKTLCLYLALDTAAYDGTKYKVFYKPTSKTENDVACLYRIKNDKRVRYSFDLISDMMRARNVKYNLEREKVNYALDFPHKEYYELIAMGEIREREVAKGTAPISGDDEENDD